MERTHHCALCQNKRMNLKTGVICGVTGKKPNFKSKCLDIDLDSEFQQKLELAILSLHLILKVRNRLYLKYLFFILISLIVLIKSSFFAKSIIENYNETYGLRHTFGMIAIAATTILLLFFNWIRFREKLNSAKFKKKKIDDVLDLYKISYQSKLIFNNKVHGQKEVDIRLKFQNWKKTETSTLYILQDI